MKMCLPVLMIYSRLTCRLLFPAFLIGLVYGTVNNIRPAPADDVNQPIAAAFQRKVDL